MKRHDVSFLRKQESRFIPAQAGTQAIWSNMEFSYFLDSRVCGNDTLGLGCRGRGGLLHSAKMLLEFYFLDSHFRGNDTLGVPPRGEAGCSIRLKRYLYQNAHFVKVFGRGWTHPGMVHRGKNGISG